MDGNSIINRTYYATETSFMKTAEDCIQALYTVLNIFLKYLEEDNPDYVAVCFDVKHPTFDMKNTKNTKRRERHAG